MMRPLSERLTSGVVRGGLALALALALGVAPAAAQATLNKLTLVGYERDEILKLMALVLAREIRQMLEQDRPFDIEGYETQLRNLPDLAE